MKIKGMFMCAAVLGLLSAGANAQSRGEGWEFGADLLYQNSQDVDFDGGTSVEFDSDIGISLYAGYRFSERLEVQMAANTVEISASDDTSHGRTSGNWSRPCESSWTCSSNRPWYVRASRAPRRATACAMAHEMERLLATPTTRPCFPVKSVIFGVRASDYRSGPNRWGVYRPRFGPRPCPGRPCPPPWPGRPPR